MFGSLFRIKGMGLVGVGLNELVDFLLQLVETLEYIVVIVADHSIDEDGVDERETDDAADDEEEDEVEPDEEDAPRAIGGSDGIGDVVPTLDGEEPEDTVDGIPRRAEVFWGDMAEEGCRKECKNADNNEISDEEGEGFAQRLSEVLSYLFYSGEEVDEAEEAEGTQHPEDEQEGEVGDGKKEGKNGGQREEDEGAIEAIPSTAPVAQHAINTHLGEHLDQEDEGA